MGVSIYLQKDELENREGFILSMDSQVTYCCRDCGNKISLHSAVYGEGRCKSCAAKGKLNSQFNKQKFGKDANRYVDGRYLKIYFCKLCNKKIHIQTALIGTGICRDCRNTSGKNNPNWCGGIEIQGYPWYFNEMLKNEIRKRDNYTCQYCELKEEKYYRVLDVHHIDYNKQNCNKKNLITLCSICNLVANANRDYWFAYYTYLMENR